MNCQQYVFLLTSDQLQQPTTGLRLQARWHLLKCRQCRLFTRKDHALMLAVAVQCQADKAALIPPYKS
jgi:hypothetical protein